MHSSDEKFNSFLEIVNNTALNYPKDKTVVDLFLDQVQRTPNNIAVVFGNSKLTYKELDIRSNQLADYLIKNKNIAPRDLVGLMLERSEWLIVAILGVLKAGATYIPIDVEYPEQRKNYIKEDSDCKIVFDISLLNDFQDTSENYSINLPQNLNTKSEDLIYIIYTSGTTGNPKGVMIEHKSVVNLIYSQTKRFKVDATEKILQFSSYCFDASIEQIFLALFNGATLCVISKEELKNHLLPSFIEKHLITHLHATPSYLGTLPDLSKFKSLKRIIAGGETCTIKLADDLSTNCDFYNEYGPTETTVTSIIHKYSKEDLNKIALPIGIPIGNTKAYILSETLEPLPIGEVGELYLSGDGLARGYLNQEELTSTKFISNPFESNQKLYKTGDFGKWNKNGTLEFIGRQDDQVKIRGYRIELGEIETTLNALPDIKQAIVVTNDTIVNEIKLIAYVQSKHKDVDSESFRGQLLEVLPEYMVPSQYIMIDEFPATSNGKIDKKNLPNPINQRPDTAPVLRKFRNETEKGIVAIWREQLGISEIGIDDNFFEMGGTSLLTQKVVALLKEELGLEVPVAKIYQYPTISELSEFLNIEKDNSKTKKTIKKKKTKGNGDVAIIGMAGRFPGATSIQELWEVLRDGKETISFFTPEELDKTIPEGLRNDPLYVGARGIIPSAKEFDAKFFGINPKLAEAMDPQQRVFLEIAWEALEHSGYLPKHYDGRVGVYAGSGTNTYYTNNVLPNEDVLNLIGRFQANTVNDKDYIATRTAYHLNLKGPAVSVYSACSTSLLAIAEAVESIRNGQCDVALAGGSSVTSPIHSGHLYQEGSMLSSDGHCRSFDAEAKGTVFSDGAGVILLKSLEEAINDGDVIHGVIKGIGINNDGGDKGSFTAPSIEGEAGAISNALNDAGINPSSITYLETHGTATPMGDPIEIEGLNKAFGHQDVKGYCAIGSVKSNMGHLTAAAGVAGVIKAVLAMKYQKLPASLGFENPNPAIDFENSPFYVNNKLSDWNPDGPRRAGVSSFGVGGTNVHVVLEEHKNKPISVSTGRPLQLLTWSAKTEVSLEGYKVKLGNYLSSSEDSLADVAYSLSITRDSFRHRSFAIADAKDTASKDLLSEEKSTAKSDVLKVVPTEIGFLFPGQGSQFLQMGKALYQHENVFKASVDHCAELLLKNQNLDIIKIIYPKTNTVDAENQLKDTKYTQPALFVIEYALAQLWMSWGIKPSLFCGHSVGEYVAAHLSGIFTLEDALRLITLRGQLISELPRGSMLSVRTSAEDLTDMLTEKVSVAAINSDNLCVLSGPNEAIENFSKRLDEKDIPNKLLKTSHAFHSSMMDPILEIFEKEVSKATLNVPRLPIISTVTGTWLTDAEAINPEYWSNHIRAAVRFSDAMDTAKSLDDSILLEVGPGRALSTLSKQKKGKTYTSISSLLIPSEKEGSYHSILPALGQLWLKGVDVDWNAFYEDQTRQKVWLPSYVFDRKLCWLDPPSRNFTTENAVVNNIPQPIEINTQINTQPKVMRSTTILEKISEIILNTSGIEIEPSEYDYSFLELGLDSLVLTQMSITCKNEFNIPITFRQLNDEFGTPKLLASYLDENLPEEQYNEQPIPKSIVESTTNIVANPLVNGNTSGQTNGYTNGHVNANQDVALNIIAQQLQLLGKQLETLQGGNNSVVNTVKVNNSKQDVSLNASKEKQLTNEEIVEHKKPFGASPKIDNQSSDLNAEQEAFLKELTVSYNSKTAASKAYTQKHRTHMSDPRVVSGFKPNTKELVYPIVIGKSSGNRLWDLDGNEYLDALNGFGSCLFGHQPDFIKEALHNQVELGFEVGPQHPLAGEVCELLCEMTNNERAALCNTGSEAVLGAMRIARTVTGRSLIVAFSRSYHGINDEVIVRGSRIKKTFPAAPGIMPEAVQNMLILDYGTEESLQIIRERADEIAAVLVEPVQSRRPEFQPIEFLKEVRAITKTSNSTLIFDEIITGFRMHLGGTQFLFDIKADITTYGKVIGGGISIGAIAGSKKYMDALDGGSWQYGDDSIPEVGVTYFAGTFVRHPLALASTKASLLYMKEQGTALQTRLNAMTERLAFELNSSFKNRNLPIEITYYCSLWRLKFLEDIPFSELLFVLMRQKGIHIWDGFPCYMTVAYTDNDIDFLVKSFLESIEELIKVGIFKEELNKNSNFKFSDELNTPPAYGARLGLDESGDPAWFIEDEKNGNKYKRIEL
ncbi:polyketide synthase [uncultured Winogradskyella sp.]|uniref:polyketide synthase n=1 Tax=uncultured Winogradskyella sp. TaxID=395353 RepID=UPI00262D578B|nr:polyketide synthase [uncultured Winogradskyella sp.]